MMFCPFSNLLPTTPKENLLPVYSGAESFLTLEWRLDRFANIVLEEGNELAICSAILGEMIDLLIKSRKEEWMFTDPLLSYRPEDKVLIAKIAMRRKSVHEELQKKEIQ